MNSDSFERIFNPRTVAIVGASEDPKKMGGWCMSSFIQGRYPGKVFPINPKSREIRGIKTYTSLNEVPEQIDLAIVVVPSSAVASVLVQCAERGAKGAVIISAGFREMDDPSGQLLQKEIASLAQEKGIRLIGPNTFGMIHTHAHLNASFSPALNLLRKGSISMIGQSGGVCHLFMYTAIHEGIGLNKVVGLGNRSDVDFSDLVEYLDQDPETHSIALYIEGIEEPSSLLKSAKSIVSRKPIVALKGGKSEAIAKASIAHTGAMTGRHALYQASFSQFGIVAVDDPIELLDVARALATLPPPKGDRVAVLSGQAGPGILMTDLCIEKGLSLAEFERETLEELKGPTRDLVIRTNPVDLGFAFTREIFQYAVTTVLLYNNVDGFD
ncbi:MAG: acetyl-CoA synthetase, partial [Desulfobacteraceae bacterium]|nr:acetyl-CoA synthetase [Desulfobacteraceae bacterium]